LVLDGVEDFVDGKPQQDEVLFCSKSSEWIWKENRERLLLEDGLPLILVAGMGRSFTLRVHLLSFTAAFERMIDRTLHSLLQLNVRLGRDRTSLICVT